MATFRLMDGTSGRPGVGSSGTQPPSTATAYSGPYVAGLVFSVDQVCWLESFWWYVPATGGNTAAQEFALWQAISGGGVLVPAATVTSGTLTAGWNEVVLPAPLPLTPFFPYVAATGLTSTSPNGFPSTQNQFGVGQPYAAGIANGPLSAFVNGSGQAFSMPQSPFSAIGSDPTVNFPGTNDLDDILWLDVKVTDVLPASVATFRGFPSSPGGFGGFAQNLAYTLGVEFSVSVPCTLARIWHYSPATSTILPSRCAIWDAATHAVVAGTDNLSPSWSGGAGSGWVSCDYSSSGVTLQPGANYKASTFTADNTDIWFAATANFWGGGGLWSGGIANGPLLLPGNSAATAPGQDSWNQGTTWTYPATSTNPEYDGVDVEVAPVTSGAGLLMAGII